MNHEQIYALRCYGPQLIHPEHRRRLQRSSFSISERIQISAPALPRLSQSFTTIMAPQLPWSDEMISTFLNLVISKGVHVADKAAVKKTWNELHDDLYKNACWAPYKAVPGSKVSCHHPYQRTLQNSFFRLVHYTAIPFGRMLTISMQSP